MQANLNRDKAVLVIQPSKLLVIVASVAWLIIRK